MIEIYMLTIGALFGLISGLLISKKLGFAPNVKVLKEALAYEEELRKKQVSQWRGRFKEYEQPSELQQMMGQIEGMEEGDLVTMVVNNIGGVKSLPRWLRPFLPAIQEWIKANPDKVKAIMEKALKGKGSNGNGEKSLDSQYLGDSL